ncbi:MAG TPA: FAD:protein FMN transferase [Steroidobacter sp.]|nr:FAD:protein FMN transferase [Steroidobacter sp.]
MFGPVRSLLGGAALLIALCAIAGCGRAPQEWVRSGLTMGSTYTVKIAQALSAEQEAQAQEAIDSVLEVVDRTMSGYRSDSEIVRFNESRSTEWFAVSEELAQVVRIALTVSEQSHGAFDVTLAPLVEAWGFGPEQPRSTPPDQSTLSSLRDRAGWRKLHARSTPSALRKDDPELEVDLNGVAPGYAVDLIAERLQALGVANFMIDVGGEIRVGGRNAHGEAWRIAVERPLEGSGLYATLRLTDVAVATSGDYRRYYEHEGRRYSHTIDPGTLRPVEHALASVVVVSPSAALSDAWATAYNVLGAQEGRRLADDLTMPVMFIERAGASLRAQMSGGFDRYVEGAAVNEADSG